MSKILQLSTKTRKSILVSSVSVSGKLCSSIGDHNEDVFADVDRDFYDDYFYSSVTLKNKPVNISIYRQGEGIICSPKEIFDDIGKLEEISFPTDRYIKNIILEHRDLLYFDWYGTFFVYKSEHGNYILVQVCYSSDNELEVIPFRYDEFKMKINFMKRSMFVVLKNFI